MKKKRQNPTKKSIVPITINKSNLIINAIGHPSAMAQKIFNMALRYIDIDKKHNPVQLEKLKEIEHRTGVDFSTGIVSKFKQADFLRLIPGRSTRWYEIRSYMFSKDKGLATEYIVSIPNSKGVSTGFNALITGAYYDEDTRDIYIKFQDSEIMRKELTTLSNYTQLTLNIESQFRSAYTIRIYEILDSYIGMETWKDKKKNKKKPNVYEYRIGTERLKWMIGAVYVKDKIEGVENRQLIKIQDIIGKKIDACKDDEDYDQIYTEYKQYLSDYKWDHFKKTVLEVAIGEMNALSEQIGKQYRYAPIKSGRRYKYISFYVEDLNNKSENDVDDNSDQETIVIDEQKIESIKRIREILDKNSLFSEQVSDSQCYSLATYVQFDYDRFREVYDVMLEYAMTQDSIGNVVGLLRTLIKEKAKSNKENRKVTYEDQLNDQTSSVEINVERAKRIIRDSDYDVTTVGDAEIEFIEKNRKYIALSCNIPVSQSKEINVIKLFELLKQTDELAKKFLNDESGQGTMILN